jgi:hypothetical protein
VSPADLAFLASASASAVCLIAAATALAVRGWPWARRILAGWVIGVAVYALLTAIVKLQMPTRVLQIGDVQCSDDWCLAVDRVERIPGPDVMRYVVTLRLSSRALGRPQRENGVDVQVVVDGLRFDPMPDPTALPLDTLLQPQQSVTTQRIFLLPALAQHPSLAVIHRGFPIGGLIPGREPFEKTVVRLD